MRSFLAVFLFFSALASADDVPPIQVNKPFKVLPLVLIVNACAFEQAQHLLNQAAINGVTETITSIDKATELDPDPSVARIWDSDNSITDTYAIIQPQSRYLHTRWRKGCTSDYSQFGFYTSGALYIGTNDTQLNCESTHTGPTLNVPSGTMPVVVYDRTDRRRILDNVGEEHYGDEIISKLQIWPGPQSTVPIRLLNSEGNPTNVYFDPTRYITCLKEKMGVP